MTSNPDSDYDCHYHFTDASQRDSAPIVIKLPISFILLIGSDCQLIRICESSLDALQITGSREIVIIISQRQNNEIPASVPTAITLLIDNRFGSAILAWLPYKILAADVMTIGER